MRSDEELVEELRNLGSEFDALSPCEKALVLAYSRLREAQRVRYIKEALSVAKHNSEPIGSEQRTTR